MPQSTVQGSRLETHLQIAGYLLNCLEKPVFMAVSKHLLIESGIDHRLKSCKWWGNKSIFSAFEWHFICCFSCLFCLLKRTYLKWWLVIFCAERRNQKILKTAWHIKIKEKTMRRILPVATYLWITKRRSMQANHTIHFPVAF